MLAVAIGLTGIVRMAVIVVDAAGDRAAVEDVAAAGAADGPVSAGATVDAGGRAEEDTKSL